MSVVDAKRMNQFTEHHVKGEEGQRQNPGQNSYFRNGQRKR